jgi:hypothetical protein
MDALTRELVWRRAGQRCEYCRIHQEDEPFYRFHVEHVVAKQHAGSDDTRIQDNRIRLSRAGTNGAAERKRGGCPQSFGCRQAGPRATATRKDADSLEQNRSITNRCWEEALKGIESELTLQALGKETQAIGHRNREACGRVGRTHSN